MGALEREVGTAVAGGVFRAARGGVGGSTSLGAAVGRAAGAAAVGRGGDGGAAGWARTAPVLVAGRPGSAVVPSRRHIAHPLSTARL
jgi:hypothetical protein